MEFDFDIDFEEGEFEEEGECDENCLACPNFQHRGMN